MVALSKLISAFPYPAIRPAQEEALEFVAKSPTGALVEMPTGEGKTAFGWAVLGAHSNQGQGPLFYITPTKNLVEQVGQCFPGQTASVYGRGEYPCLYYEDRGIGGVSAQESPCYMLKCPHRVNQQDGMIEDPRAMPCPYFQAKFEASRGLASGRIVVCTTAFFLINRLLVTGWRNLAPAAMVIDEVHKIARVARGIFEYTVTEYHLERAAGILDLLDKSQADILRQLKNQIELICQQKRAKTPALIEEKEVDEFLKIVRKLDAASIEQQIRDAVARATLDPVGNRREIKLLEDLSRGIPRLADSLGFALTTSGRQPLNYVMAFWYPENDLDFQQSRKQARFVLTIRAYYVRPLIQKALGGQVIGMSATIGNPAILANETGLDLPFKSIGSSFDTDHTRIYLPKDTPNLSFGKRRNDDPRLARKAIAEAAAQFAAAGHRSLVVVVSEEDRSKVTDRLTREGLRVVTYGNGVSAKKAAQKFKDGEGQVLVGTAAQYAEGIDLPKQVAPVIIFLRPGYQRPDDPMTRFEEKRFPKSHCWALWQYRVMLEALQVRGRNIRSADDVGLCIFISQQFRDFLFPALPQWLRPAYCGDLTMDQIVQEGLKLLA